MPRKSGVRHRDVPKDPIFNSKLATQFINKLMYDGEKSVAQHIFYEALKVALRNLENQPAQGDEEKKRIKDGLALLELAVKNVSPQVEVRSRRVGGATYQVPVEVPNKRRVALAIRWLIDGARKRKEKGMIRRLAAELLDAAVHNKGNALEKLSNVLKTARANLAYAHYRW